MVGLRAFVKRIPQGEPERLRGLAVVGRSLHLAISILAGFVLLLGGDNVGARQRQLLRTFGRVVLH